MTDQERILDLRRQLHEANRLYYVENSPVLSDQQFDEMMHELERLELNHPEMADANSPTQRVGSDLEVDESGNKKSKEFVKVKHKYPMLSLANTYSREDVQSWFAQVSKGLAGQEFDICCEMKYDGLSISLIYENGRLVRAVTRGDGEYGDDVTENVKTIRSIPLVLPDGDYPDRFEIRGEILLPWDKFKKLNANAELAGETKFANPRNAASGTLKLHKSKEVAKRGLDAYLYYLLGEQVPCDGHYENLEKCSGWGFQISKSMRKLQTLDQIMEFITYWDTERKNLPVATDGIVLKVNSVKQQNQLGYTAKSPRWAIAYKFKADRVRTRLRQVTYQVGKTGAITPVANMDPVLLAGTIVKRASLYNEDNINNLDLHVGDYVYVEKGGEIIPKVVGVDIESRQANAEKIQFITHCPVCGFPLKRESDLAIHYCHNDGGCSTQLKAHIEQFVSRKAMNIKGLGEEKIDKYFDSGLIRNPADIYTLTKEQLMSFVVDQSKGKDADNLLAAIQASKSMPFEQLVFALGIRFIGENSAKIIARHFKNIEALQNASIEELLEIEGVGDVMANSIYEFFHNAKTLDIVMRLKEYGLCMAMQESSKAEITSNKLEGKSIVISGVFVSHSREEYKMIIEQNGGKNVNAVSQKTSFILAGDKMGPSKLAKARSLGVSIVTEKKFLEMINN